MSETRSPRFAHWVAFLVFSTITLGSMVEVIKDKDYEPDSVSAERWSLACAAITFCITTIIVLMHLNAVSSLLIVETRIEGGLTVILSIFWIATVAVVTDSRHGIAVDEYGAVSNGNLYYFSWAGFVCSITLLVSYLRHVFGVDVAGSIRSRSVRLTTWSALLATSLVVMGSAANFFDTSCGGNMDDNEKGRCSRAVFGIVLGALATLGSVWIVGLKIATSKAPFLVEVAMALLLLILYGFGVISITGQKGPGAPLGNLYYFTWASFLASFMLLASCFEDYNAAASTSTTSNNGNTSDNTNNGNSAPSHVISDDPEDQI